jgi:ferrous iron transport protein A
MKGDNILLSKVTSGKDVRLFSIKGGRCFRARLMDMGLNTGVKIKVLNSYGHGPTIILAGNTRLILGHGMANKIVVKED